MANTALEGKPYAGNPHVRIDEGDGASAKPRRSSLLYKKSMRVAGWIVLCGLGVGGLVSPCVADGGMGMYAGKGVTADGSILIGQTVDCSPGNAPMVQQICEAGTQVAFNGATNKYRYVCTSKATSLNKGRYLGSAANEKGVILAGAIAGATRNVAYISDGFRTIEDGGVGGVNLPDYLIGNAATAREAVGLLGEAVKRYGQAGPEIYMVADTNEAWYVEVYTGHDWAAVKMPENKVAVFGNHFNLRSFLVDAPDVMHSPNLVFRAVNEGLAVWIDSQNLNLDLFQTFADADSVQARYNNFRAWYGHKHFAPSSVTPYERNLVPGLFFTPDYPIAPTNMFELMRSRYEDLSDAELPTPRTNAAIRVIGSTRQAGCHVLQLDCRATTPERMRGTLWSCLGQAEHGVFHPINASQDYLPAAYTNDARRTFGYDPRRAADAFRRLSALTQSNRTWYGPGVRDYWRAREAKMVEFWPSKLDESIAFGNTATLSVYTRDQEERSFAAAKRIYDELMWYAAAHNRIQGDGSGATDTPEKAFKPSDDGQEAR